MIGLTDGLIQVTAAFCGTLGFGFLLNSRGKKLIFAALGGMMSWALFLLLGFITKGEPMRYFIVSVIITLYAEILARILKTPASTFCILSLIPLVPGGALYYSSTYALSGDTELFVSKAVYTLELTVALSLGIVLVTACMKYFTDFVRRVRGMHG